MSEQIPGSTHEERPKVNWFLHAALGFFLVLFVAMLEVPNSLMKWAWLGIAGLNVVANGMQIVNTRNTRYVLWKRGLSIYIGNSREALVRYDKALVFKQYRGLGKSKADLKEYGVNVQLRTYPAFGARRRWLVIFERDDGERRALVFDPSPGFESAFRQKLIETEEAAEAVEVADSADEPAGGSLDQAEPDPPADDGDWQEERDADGAGEERPAEPATGRPKP